MKLENRPSWPFGAGNSRGSPFSGLSRNLLQAVTNFPSWCGYWWPAMMNSDRASARCDGDVVIQRLPVTGIQLHL